jgi:hypothetical protein
MNIEINGRYFMPHDYDEEIWKSVKGYPSYLISNMWRVKRKDTGKVLTPSRNGNKWQMSLSNKGKRTKFPFIELMQAAGFENIPKFKYRKTKLFKTYKNDEFIGGAF